ncbi:MAG: cytochrome P450 [Proteobacteria bacterium]|nr:cytochrome P450 [Pseudomonadota bacterium]
MDMEAQKEIPQVRGHWFYGSLRELNESPHSFFANAGPEGHGLFQFRILHKKMISVVDADCALHIFKTNSQNYIRGSNFKKLQAILGLGLICLEGDLWKQHRRFVAPAFKPDFLKYSLSQNIQLIHSLLEEWTQHSLESKPVEIVDQMRRFTLSVIVKALFSIDIDLEKNQQLYRAIVEANDLIFRRNFSPFPFPNWVPTPLNRRIAHTRRAMDKFSNQQISLKQQNPDRDTNDIVDYLLTPNQNGELSHDEMLDEIRTLFIAGFETTATSLTWALYLIARTPDVAARWMQELDHCLGKRDPTWDDIAKLKYTENIFKETLRLYPPAYGLSRMCVAEDINQGYRIPAGSPLLVSIFGIHRSAKYWEDPDQFKPERFEKDWPQHAYLPFGMGKHSCIGSRFAYIEAILILASIGQRFTLALEDSAEVPPNAKVTLLPSRKIFVHLRQRT